MNLRQYNRSRMDNIQCRWGLGLKLLFTVHMFAQDFTIAKNKTFS